MKKTLFFICTLFCFTFFSCSDEQNIEISDEQNLQLSLENESNNFLGYRDDRKLLSSGSIECLGGCDNNTRSCSLIANINDPSVVQCSCGGCRMVITTRNSQGKEYFLKDIEISSNKSIEFFVKAVKTENKTLQSINIEKIDYEFYDDAKVFYITYYDESNELNSKMLISTLETINNIEFDPIVVDCRGGCDERGKSCRESFDMNTGIATCTCEGSCTMYINED